MTDQESVKEFIHQHNLGCDLQSRMLDLISEVGELSKEVLKGSNYGKQSVQITENFGMEIGDVFFSLCCVASEANIDLSKALSLVLQKYEDRIRKNQSADSGK